MPGYLVNMSIEKAFDSVDYNFFVKCFKKNSVEGNLKIDRVLLNNQQSHTFYQLREKSMSK